MPKTKNILSVDFEDYFCDLPFETWNEYENRVVETTPILLELFSKYNVKATFFVVGYFAEKFPKLINEIQDCGHEIASHSFSHIDLRKVSKNVSNEDLVNSFYPRTYPETFKSIMLTSKL